jgi:hypothetical protein
MKLIIKEFNNFKIYKTIKQLDGKYTCEKCDIVQLYTSYDIYELYNNNIYKLNVKDDINYSTVICHGNDKSDILVDYSTCEKKTVNSLPFILNNYIKINKTYLNYTTPESNYIFVIECEKYYKNNNNVIVPLDIYFILKNTNIITNGYNISIDKFIIDILNIIK